MPSLSKLPSQLKQFLVSREVLRRRNSQFVVPLSELDFTGCEREGQSYLELPKTFKRLWCEGREHETPEIVNQLNDDFVSIPQGSEEDAFRHVKKNPNKEVLHVIVVGSDCYEEHCCSREVHYIAALLIGSLYDKQLRSTSCFSGFITACDSLVLEWL